MKRQNGVEELGAMLPQSLAEALAEHAAKTPYPRSRSFALHAEEAKKIVSRAVGWDSSDPDNHLYEVAIKYYSELAGR